MRILMELISVMWKKTFQMTSKTNGSMYSKRKLRTLIAASDRTRLSTERRHSFGEKLEYPARAKTGSYEMIKYEEIKWASGKLVRKIG